MRPVFLIFVTIVLFASAHASISVVGNGIARSCYHHANRGGVDGEATCTAALDHEALSVRDRAATYVNRGVIRSNLHRYSDALADYERAIGYARYLSNSDLGLAYVDRSSVLIAMGRYREGLDSVNKGIDLETIHPEIAHYNRALAKEGLGDVKGAWLDFKRALELEPDFTPARDQLKRFRVTPNPGGS